MSLGEELRRLRGNSPQRSIADQLGISPALLSNYENDYNLPAYNRLHELAELYATPEEVEDLFEKLLMLRNQADAAERKTPTRVSKSIMRSIHEVLVEILAEMRAARLERERQEKT